MALTPEELARAAVADLDNLPLPQRYREPE